MAIELSNLTFTDEDDIVPASGVEEIFNNGIANTLAGDDIITGTGGTQGFLNRAIFNSGDGNDIITGTGTLYGLITGSGASFDTGKGNDIITGIGGSLGVLSSGTVNTGSGEGSIISQGTLLNRGEVFLADDNDSITANRNRYRALENFNTIDTGDGNDIITSIVSFTTRLIFIDSIWYWLTTLGATPSSLKNLKVSTLNLAILPSYICY